RRFHVVTSLFLIASASFGNLSAAPEEALPAYKIKSGFLYNFAKFIKWPSKKFTAPDAPLIIGLIGSNPFGAYLTELEGKPIGNHRIQVEIYTSANDAHHC